MEKEKESAKQVIEHIIQSEPIDTPHKLADCYLTCKKGKPIMLPGMLGTSITVERMLDYADHLHAKDNLIDGLDELRKSLIYEPVKRRSKKFSPQTAKLLKENYPVTVIKRSIQALDDFSIAIDFSLNKKSRTNRLPKFFKKIYSEQVEACNTLLSTAFLTLTEKNTIELIKRTAELGLKEIKEIKLDPVKEFELEWGLAYAMNPLSPDNNPTKYYEEWNKAISKLILRKEKGRPKDIFFKTLQIVIYTFLTESKPKKVKSYKQWAQKLTASIINEFYKDKGLPNLAPKDIDNALHSS